MNVDLIYANSQCPSAHDQAIIHVNEEDTRLSSMDSATLESCVRGHHIYKAVWSPFVGEELVCLKEDNNSHDHCLCVEEYYNCWPYQGRFLLPVLFFFREKIPALLVQSQGADAILLTYPEEDLKFPVY